MVKAKVVVLATESDASFAVCHLIESLFSACHVIFERPESRLLFVRRRIKKLGLFQVLGQLAFQALLVPVLEKKGSARISFIQRHYGLKIEPVIPDKATHVASVNSPEAIGAVQSLQPDVIVLSGTRILGKSILRAIRCPVINIHAGITPLYRGVHGAYWALAERRPELCGVTVHRVDLGIDTGEVLAQARISPGPEDNFATYPWMQLGEGLRLLAQLLPKIIINETVCSTPMVSESRLRSHPTIWTYLRNYIRGGIK